MKANLSCRDSEWLHCGHQGPIDILYTACLPSTWYGPLSVSFSVFLKWASVSWAAARAAGKTFQAAPPQQETRSALEHMTYWLCPLCSACAAHPVPRWGTRGHLAARSLRDDARESTLSAAAGRECGANGGPSRTESKEGKWRVRMY